MNGWTSQDTFSCFVPIKQMIVKSGDKGADKSGKRWIQGIASTDGRDLQGEIIEQKGIDFDYFLKHGYFNDDHKAGPEYKVGQPTHAELTKNGLFVKGFLFKNPDSTKETRADYYWNLMNELRESGSDRKVGFSIQGKVIRRAGNKIEKCWIQDIAITTQPVNTASWAEIAKSLSAAWGNVEDTSKAMDSVSSVAKVESLDEEEKKTVEKSQLLTRQEAIDLVKSELGLSDTDTVQAIVNVAFGLFAQE